MKSAGFNLIRLPFSSDIFEAGVKANPAAIDPTLNADLLNLTRLQIVDRLVASAGQRGIRIILDYHRSAAGAASESGRWYDSTHSEASWIANWKMLAGRYASDPTVVGVNLFNEVHAGVTLEADNVKVADNWRWAAKRCANEILSVNPHLLICVQGLDAYKGEGGWWGAVHLGLHDVPLTLDVANQLVYEIHDYGPIVFDQPFHQDPAFPNNMPGFWDHQWGFIHNDGLAPVWVGEWGAVLDDSIGTWSSSLRSRESLWFGTLKTYILSKGLSWTWWCWTPESADTHGMLKDDYSGLNTTKMSEVSTALYAGFSASSGGPPLPPAGSPYSGTPVAIPGTVEAENFDNGGEGTGYHDSDTTNSGGQYRTTGVYIEATGDTGGGYDVGWVSAGEWLQYTVDVASGGTYTVTFRVASASTGGTLHLSSGATNLTGTVTVPPTGGWQTWQSVTATGVSLSAGTQALRLVLDGGSFNVNSMTFTLNSSSSSSSSGSGGGGGGCGLTGLETLLVLLAARRCARLHETSRRNRRARPSA